MVAVAEADASIQALVALVVSVGYNSQEAVLSYRYSKGELGQPERCLEKFSETLTIFYRDCCDSHDCLGAQGTKYPYPRSLMMIAKSLESSAFDSWGLISRLV